MQVYKLIAQDTIEEKIVELQQAKQSLADTVTGTADGAILSMRPDELLQLLEERTMKYALFSVPVGTIYDLPQTIKEGEEGLVSTIGDEGLYGQACQVRTAPGGVTAAGVRLPPDVAEVVSFYGYHGYVDRRELQFVREEELWEYLGQTSFSWAALRMSSTCPRCRASG